MGTGISMYVSLTSIHGEYHIQDVRPEFLPKDTFGHCHCSAHSLTCLGGVGTRAEDINDPHLHVCFVFRGEQFTLDMGDATIDW